MRLEHEVRGADHDAQHGLAAPVGIEELVEQRSPLIGGQLRQKVRRRLGQRRANAVQPLAGPGQVDLDLRSRPLTRHHQLLPHLHPRRPVRPRLDDIDDRLTARGVSDRARGEPSEYGGGGQQRQPSLR